MGFNNPVVGVDPGPDYASNITAALTTIGAHTHLGPPLSGVQIVSAAIDINADLPFNNFNLDNIRTSRFYNNTTTLSASGDLNCLYFVSGIPYYNNASGTPFSLQLAANTGTAGQFLIENATATAQAFASLSGDVSASISTPGLITINQISGNSPITITNAPILKWNASISSPQITQTIAPTGAGTNLTISAQSGNNATGGSLILSGGAGTVAGNVIIQSQIYGAQRVPTTFNISSTGAATAPSQLIFNVAGPQNIAFNSTLYLQTATGAGVSGGVKLTMSVPSGAQFNAFAFGNDTAPTGINSDVFNFQSGSGVGTAIYALTPQNTSAVQISGSVVSATGVQGPVVLSILPHNTGATASILANSNITLFPST